MNSADQEDIAAALAAAFDVEDVKPSPQTLFGKDARRLRRINERRARKAAAK